MNLLLDTNILVFLSRTRDTDGFVDFINPDNSTLYISVVSEAEIKSLELKNKWGAKRNDILHNFLDEVNIVEITQSYVNAYAQIDAYLQRVNPGFNNYPFDTPRNMGKNDLWIASLAALLGLELVTTDGDFDHLHNVYFPVRKIVPEEFQRYF
jgi:tRNA(fMet)-specific endonuclease VapC